MTGDLSGGDIMGKKFTILALLCLLLTGCGTKETFETVDDLYVQPAAQPQFLHVNLPEEAAVPTLEHEGNGSVYLCDGYTMTMQVLPGGSLDTTLSQLTGFSTDRLTLMHTKQAKTDRYECVWTSAGEGMEQVGRLVILDDGNYHYAVTVMAPADTAGELTQTWQKLLNSAALSTD